MSLVGVLNGCCEGRRGLPVVEGPVFDAHFCEEFEACSQSSLGVLNRVGPIVPGPRNGGETKGVSPW